jgi:hypothetical protein
MASPTRCGQRCIADSASRLVSTISRTSSVTNTLVEVLIYVDRGQKIVEGREKMKQKKQGG